MKSAALFLFVLGLGGVLGQTTNVQPCIYQGDASHLPIHFYVSGCTDPPCLVPHNTTIEMQMVFKAPRRLMSLRTAAVAYVLGPIGTSYPLGDDEFTCNYLANTYCPLLEDEVVQYTLRMDIETWMPTISVTIEFVVRDHADRSTVVCTRLPISVIPVN